jgi:hypothetical protein
MTSMETRYFKNNFIDEEVTARIESSLKIKAVIVLGLFGKKPVYMITGLKIVKNFSLEASIDKTLSGNINKGALITPAKEVFIRAELGGSRYLENKSSFRSGADIIFIYQLHIIAMKGWRQKRFKTEVYKSKHAFLDEREEEEEGEGMEATLATKEDLEAV